MGLSFRGPAIMKVGHSWNVAEIGSVLVFMRSIVQVSVRGRS